VTRDLFASAIVFLSQSYEAVDKISADIDHRAVYLRQIILAREILEMENVNFKTVRAFEHQ